VVVSHDTQADPHLNYGNQQALDLWELSWAQLTSTPSRLTAEPMNRDERARMLAVAEKQGYYSGYRGIRISSTGKRFLVEDATVWNVVDGQGIRVGQAPHSPVGLWCRSCSLIDSGIASGHAMSVVRVGPSSGVWLGTPASLWRMPWFWRS
jgi:hypothetical protein